MMDAEIKAYLSVPIIESPARSLKGPAFACYTANAEIDETQLLDSCNDKKYLASFDRAIKALRLEAPHTELIKEVRKYEDPDRKVWLADPAPEEDRPSADDCFDSQDAGTAVEKAVQRYKTSCIDCRKAREPEIMWLGSGELPALNVDDQKM